jgi:hypothetical protein
MSIPEAQNTGGLGKPSTVLGRVKALQVQEYALAGVVVLLFVVGAILKPDTFPTWDNVRNMLTQASVIGVLAIGMTFVIATAGIDLSVGSMVAACRCDQGHRRQVREVRVQLAVPSSWNAATARWMRTAFSGPSRSHKLWALPRSGVRSRTVGSGRSIASGVRPRSPAALHRPNDMGLTPAVAPALPAEA